MALTKIGTDGVKDDAISHNKIPANAIQASELADNSVDTAAIVDDAVTDAKLANSINSAIAANTAKTSLENNSVTTARIADEAVTLAKLEHGTSSNDGKFLRANNGADPSFETVSIPPSFVSGMIILWSGAQNAIPSGWVLCNGSNSTPDLRDRFVVGAGNSYSVGATGGNNTATDTVSISGSDTVNISVSGTTNGNTLQHVSDYNTYGAGTKAIRFNYSGTDATRIQVPFSGSGSDTVSISGSDTVSVDTRSPYYALCYIMKT